MGPQLHTKLPGCYYVLLTRQLAQLVLTFQFMDVDATGDAIDVDAAGDVDVTFLGDVVADFGF